jgi:hypothetical protein
MSDIPSDSRCQLVSVLGRRCREPRCPDHPAFCRYHARMQKEEEEQSHSASETTALELLGPVQDFRSAASINRVLGKLLVLVNTERIAPRNAAVTAYICQLLLQTLSAVKNEIHELEQDSARISPRPDEALKQILTAPQFTPTLSEPANGQGTPLATDDWPLATTSQD